MIAKLGWSSIIILMELPRHFDRSFPNKLQTHLKALWPEAAGFSLTIVETDSQKSPTAHGMTSGCTSDMADWLTD